MDNNIKKVITRIYEFDLSHTDLIDGTELGSSERGNDFINNFKSRDLDKGVIVMPLGYTNGLVYKSTNNGEIYNHPSWTPDIVKFSLNLYGLKRKAFYRVTVIGRNTHKFTRVVDITDDRVLHVSTDLQELIIEKDFSDNLENVEVSGIFRADSTEMNLFFRLGKIYINNIIIDEVELLSDEIEEIDITKAVEIENSKLDLVGVAIFSPSVVNEKGKYKELTRISGKGINLYYDSVDKKYILERDNNEDSIGESFTNLRYIVDFNFNKMPNPGIFDRYEITEISPDISPNTLKQGYLCFKLFKDNTPIFYENLNGRLVFIIKKLF